LDIKGEKELLGKGVSYCVTCDSFFFKNRTVGVIGGSDCAATSALALADIAKRVYVLYRGRELKCEDITSAKLRKRDNVEIIYNITPLEILGKDKVEGIVLKEKNKNREIKLDGIFIEVGSIPLTKYTKKIKLNLDSEKNIFVSEDMGTSIPGIFAAGDVTHHKLKQVIVSAGQGAIAAKSAYDYLSKLESH
jgi:thioredoxin reductase (NADPH)